MLLRATRNIKTLPLLLGDDDDKSKNRKLSSHRYGPTKTLDVSNLSNLLATPIKCTLPLADILRVKLELWEGGAKCLEKMGIEVPNGEFLELKGDHVKPKCKPVPFNKVGEYCEGEDGNTTLLVEFNKCTHEAILESGVGIAIATKETWESWGRPALRKTRMKLQLVDGYIEKPLVLLEKVIVTSCGVEYEHTFAVVDFGKSLNCDII